MSKSPLALGDANFEAVTASTEQPILIDFYADWCGPCKALTPVVNELAEEFEGRATIAKVDVDKAPEVAGRFGVRSIPTLIILQNGYEVDRMVGLTTKRVLADKLESLEAAVKG